MDPSYESSEDEAEAMAKAMGFSSFGTQGPTKKRKFNPKTDAMVEGQELASLDRGGKKGQGSGGNKIPLGKPRVLGVSSKSNQEEIELDEEDEEPMYIDTSLPPPSKQDGSEEDESPAYIDTSLPPPNDEARAAQQKIDAILASRTTPPVPPDSKIKMKPQISEVGRGVGRFMSALQDELRPPIPSVPAPAPAPATSGRSHMNHHQPRQRGQKNEFWYVGYYDASFNENPWAKLEKANGLEPMGTWIERGGQAA
jgi:hypothetical protein